MAFTAGDVDLRAYAALAEACPRLRFLPTFRHGILLDVAMVAPEDEGALGAIRQLTHQEVRCFGVGREEFEDVIRELEAGGLPHCLVEEASAVVKRAGVSALHHWDFHRSGARGVAVELVEYAFRVGASDLFLDEQEEWLDVAIKHAGAKEMLPPVERTFAPLLLKSFKEMAGLSTHTVTGAQSGFASLAVAGGRRADLRVEVTPTVHGESLVARIHDRQLQLERMRRLPFTDPVQLALARSCLRRQQGLIVVTGPTGHGKTTTLYSCLGQLDRSALNIRTLEDPVEFAVPWITQIPVGAGTGRNFAEGLKSLLRQAPNVILMGEIRDPAVARTCLEAADTGHLILATVHARDAIGVVSRFLDLGVAGGQLAGALTVAIGQRLVRRLCPHCRRPSPPTPEQARHFAAHGLAAPPRLHVAGGCAACGRRGIAGMVPIFEFFHPAGDEALEEGIARATRETYSEGALRACWLGLGGSSLVREGLRLAAAGEVAHAEILQIDRHPPC